MARVRAGSINALETITMAAKLSSTAMPLQAASTAMRRIARERGPITRRVAAQGVVLRRHRRGWSRSTAVAAFAFLTPALPDMATFDVDPRARGAACRTLAIPRDDGGACREHEWPAFFRITPEGHAVFSPDTSSCSDRLPTVRRRAHFRAAAQAHIWHA